MSGAPIELTPCPNAADTVFIGEYSPSRVTMRANMTCDGMVVLSDTFYPGWYAEVDRHPQEIHEVDLAFRGVLVKQGTHEIRFRYRPRSVLLGAVLTFTGVMGAAGLAFFSSRQRIRSGTGQ